MHWVCQGIQFGIAIWLLWAVTTFLIDFAGNPIPGKVTAKLIIFEFFDMVALGVITAALFRQSSSRD